MEVYKENPKSHKAKITETEDIALHLAVSYGKPKIVSQLVESLGPMASDILRSEEHTSELQSLV